MPHWLAPCRMQACARSCCRTCRLARRLPGGSALSEIIAGFADIEAWDAPSDARYAGPTLFIAGATSNYIKPEHRPVIRSLFPRARFVTLKNAGHWLHADNPAGFVAVVEAFLTAAG